VTAGLPTGTSSLVGPEFVKDLGTKPPRVVWVPNRERMEPADNPGSDPRQLATRAAGVQVHVWGSDYDATETLLNQVISAIHNSAQLWGAYKLTGEAGWLALDGRFTVLGRCYVFEVEFLIPVVEGPYTTGLVTSIPETGVLVVGVPPTDSNG
jgi:hypothetical protein